MEKSLDQRVKKNTHEEGEFELMSKINKIEVNLIIYILEYEQKDWKSL